MLRVQALPALTDNYIWLIENPDLQQCAVVDPGDARPVLYWLEQHPEYVLTDILITHHHQDHTAGALALREKTDARLVGPQHQTLPSLDLVFTQDGLFTLWQEQWQVMAVPGHTLDHIAFLYSASPATSWLFCGDTLFAAGCGRVFEGTPLQMHQALQRFATLPEYTLVFAAHEYTKSNLNFACVVEPNNAALQQRLQKIIKTGPQQQPTLPSDMKTELQTNPFLRTEHPDVVESVRQKYPQELLESSASVFKQLREWKNSF